MKKAPKFIIGIDEVGRGPLAGPVAVSAVLMTEKNYSKMQQKIANAEDSKNFQIRDSKKMTPIARSETYKKILQWQKEGLLDFVYVTMSPAQIDKKGIAVCLRELVALALEKIEAPTDAKILLDGTLFAPTKFSKQKTIIGGDDLQPIISLASIIAKVRRDLYMNLLSKKFLHYNFGENKGYGTKKHIIALRKYGLSKEHRHSFCTKYNSKKH